MKLAACAPSCPLDACLAAACGAAGAVDWPARLAGLQAELLRRTLARARRSRFYRRQLAAYDLNLATPAGLSALPFTRPEALQRPEDFLAVSLNEVERMVTLRSSGTTGPPKRLAFSAGDLAQTRNFFAVGMGMLVRAGERLAVLLPGAERPDGVADLLRQGLSAAGVFVLSPPPEFLRERDDLRLARWLLAQRPHALVAAPTQLARLLAFFPQAAPPGLAGILTSTEPLGAELRQRLESVWACLVLDHYGLTETCYGCALECPAHDGYHLRWLDVVVEIVDMDGDTVLPPGEVGEVVLTTLREAMPLIRYRTGDVASLLPGPCACGSPLKRLGPVLGRIARGPDGRAHIVQPEKGAARQVHRENL